MSSGYDLFIRRAEFVDSGMVALDLGTDLRHAVVASPDYLATCAAPTSPQALAGHRCIRWRPNGGEVQFWRFEVAGAPTTIAVDGPLTVSHCEAAVAAALQGVGIAYVLEAYAIPFVAHDNLVSLLTAFLPSFGGWKLCHPKQARLTAAARAVSDLLTEAAIDDKTEEDWKTRHCGPRLTSNSWVDSRLSFRADSFQSGSYPQELK